MSNALALDTLDDRREIWRLLHRLPAAVRLGYLERCCRALADARGNGLFPLPSMYVMAREAQTCDRASERLTNSVYCDLAVLAVEKGLDLLKVALDLESLVKRRHPAFASADLRLR